MRGGGGAVVVVGAWPTGAFGGLDLELYLDLGLGGSEIKCKKVCEFFLFLSFFVIFPLLFRFSRDFLLLGAETNSARMANRVGKVFLQSGGRKWEWSGRGRQRTRSSTLFRENFCANISVKLKNTYYILMSKMADALHVVSLSLSYSRCWRRCLRQCMLRATAFCCCCHV